MVRRSSRARQQPTSLYDNELKSLAEKKNADNDSDSDISAAENEVKKVMMEEDQEDDDMEAEEEEEFSPKRPAKVSPPAKKSKPIVISRGGKTKMKAPTKNTKTKRSIQSALNLLGKKALERSETPETSLVAALLSSAKPRPATTASRSFASQPPTMYTAHLESVARKLLQDHPEANSLHVQLLNLLFRSVGGSVESNLADDVDLEDMDDAEWDEQVTKVVDVMRESDTALFTAATDDKVGAREYRAIYEEFWYRLAIVVLSHTAGADGGDDDAPQKFNSNRFQVELMRDLVSRVTELVMVGQPDLRAASTAAVWGLAKASLDRTVELTTKLETAQRQYAASKGQSRKLQALQHSMDTWKRHKVELEVLVEEAVIQGVFITRYRDSNSNIRRGSLETLREIILLRPDIFLKDKYLKYLGWMTSDKEASVRLAAVKGLLAPFKYKQDKRPPSLQIKLEDMQNVCNKFLPRITECTDDAQSLEVQEAAMELVVKLVSEGFMDDFDDDDAWDRLNLKALDSNTSPGVRKNALYLVVDQLDVFDEGGDGRSVASVPVLSERQQIVRINEIAQWIAHILVDSPVSLDKIKIELTDHVVQSLREMPEHKGLTTCWSAMLKAIRSESAKKSNLREDTAKNLVLLRFLACAAELEVGESGVEDSAKKRKRSHASSAEVREGLSQALLKTLPGLLTAFKSDSMSMRSLTRLPKYLLPEIYCLPTRKNDFSSLVKNLCSAYLEMTDDEGLAQISSSLATLADGDHARVVDVKAQLKHTSSILQDRLMTLLAESDSESSPGKRKISSKKRSSRRSDASSSSVSATDSASSNLKETEIEKSICLCLARFKYLLKQLPLSLLFDDVDNENEETEVEGFFQALSEALAKRLLDRKPVLDEDDMTDASRSVTLAQAWKSRDIAIHAEVGRAVDLGLDVLLGVVAWKLREVKQDITDNAEAGVFDDDDASGHVVIRFRDGIAKLIGLCYEQYLEEQPGLVYSIEQENFSNCVQVAAGRVASDLRVLFTREWSSAKSPTLRAFALVDDSHLIGGFARYLAYRGSLHVDEDASDEIQRAKELILPIARSLTANWSDGNRKEAGIILKHLAGKGKMAGQTVHVMARMLKKINPVRFLEAQMAALRMAFQDWLEGEPEEPDTDNPSEEQMHQFEEAEKAQEVLFQAAEQLASRLSMTLGVGRLSDTRLSQALLNFMREGIRFAFEGDGSPDDDLVLGSRLPFLSILIKYAGWIKKNKTFREALANVLLDKESALRMHPEFDEVHQDDLQCIRNFQAALAISVPKRQSLSRETPTSLDESSGIGRLSRQSVGTPGSRVRSTGSSRQMSATSSQRSRVSIQSNLSPLIESPEDTNNEPGDEISSSPSPQKRRRLANSLPGVNERQDVGEEPGFESDDSSSMS